MNDYAWSWEAFWLLRVVLMNAYWESEAFTSTVDSPIDWLRFD
jgi:hypothetical protein